MRGVTLSHFGMPLSPRGLSAQCTVVREFLWSRYVPVNSLGRCWGRLYGVRRNKTQTKTQTI